MFEKLKIGSEFNKKKMSITIKETIDIFRKSKNRLKWFLFIFFLICLVIMVFSIVQLVVSIGSLNHDGKMILVSISAATFLIVYFISISLTERGIAMANKEVLKDLIHHREEKIGQKQLLKKNNEFSLRVMLVVYTIAVCFIFYMFAFISNDYSTFINLSVGLLGVIQFFKVYAYTFDTISINRENLVYIEILTEKTISV